MVINFKSPANRSLPSNINAAKNNYCKVDENTVSKDDRKKMYAYLFDACLKAKDRSDYNFTQPIGYKNVDLNPVIGMAAWTESCSYTKEDAEMYNQQILRQGDSQKNPNLLLQNVPIFKDKIWPIIDKFDAAGINWRDAKEGGADLATLQRVQEKAENVISKYMDELGIDGDIKISVDIQNNRIDVALIKNDREYMGILLEDAINKNNDLKEMLIFSASGAKIANGGADEIFYDDFNVYLQKYFGQDLSELSWENGQLMGTSPRVAEALNVMTIPGAWDEFRTRYGIPNFGSEKAFEQFAGEPMFVGGGRQSIV